ncbi:hypothetical protein E2C01_024269 [Portunus trituberculatus]|uniref:Uncharacterized protein n=1 Tax=Portunus trituberculatus TaxID=210409 RepID=A0A5B7ECQ2_PORTR|nr:hypothetical protein [Portunus trituberculatus]
MSSGAAAAAGVRWGNHGRAWVGVDTRTWADILKYHFLRVPSPWWPDLQARCRLARNTPPAGSCCPAKPPTPLPVTWTHVWAARRGAEPCRDNTYLEQKEKPLNNAATLSLVVVVVVVVAVVVTCPRAFPSDTTC